MEGVKPDRVVIYSVSAAALHCINITKYDILIEIYTSLLNLEKLGIYGQSAYQLKRVIKNSIETK